MLNQKDMKKNLMFALLLLLIPVLATLTTMATSVSFILNGQGSLTVITYNGYIYNINKTETIEVPQGVQVDIISTQYFSINGSPPTNQYSFTATNNTVLKITFITFTTTNTNNVQSNVKAILGIIVSIIGLGFLLYLYKKGKEEE